MRSKLQELTSNRILVKNILLTFIAQVVPLLIALIAIPIAIRQLGTDRFGLLSLCWAILGYLTFFDLGIGRAVTKLLAEKLALEEFNQIGALFWPSLLLLFGLSVFGGLLLGWLAPIIVEKWFNIPEALKTEAVQSLYLVAIGLPLITLISTFRGALEAAQRFDLANSLHVIWGSLNYLAPIIAIPFGADVFKTLIVLMIGRFLIFGLSVLFVFQFLPQIRSNIKFDAHLFRRVLRFGSWMTLSNLISPIMVYLDRFVIGWLLSVSVLAYYVTPYEMVTRLLIIPTAIIQVFFPALSATLTGDLERSLKLYDKIGKVLLICMVPVLLIIVLMAHEILQLWIGNDFAVESTLLLQIMSIGILTNSLARLPFTLIQASDRTHWTAMIHVAELPIFLGVLWYFTRSGGTVGTAVAGAIRFSLDLFLMMVFGQRILTKTRETHFLIIIVVVLFLLVTIPTFFVTSTYFRLPILIVSLIGYFGLIWTFLLSSEEKTVCRRYLAFSKST